MVTAHQVVYNVADIVPFLQELGRHATRRVVIEMPQRHPLASLSSAWEYFWGLTRPTEPTPDRLLEVLAEIGVRASREDLDGQLRSPGDPESAAHFDRIRLCLPASRENDVLAFRRENPQVPARPMSTIWWDV